jgi:prepilin-type N-terminal cleavage/methylation domain-containing protein
MEASVAVRARGFTLIELAVVIAIVALLLGALLVPLATQIQGRNIKETRESLAEIKEALTGYAMTQGRLPCPDTDTAPDGFENDPCGVWPQSTEGFLPYLDLGVPATDAWGRVFRYAVASEFTKQTVPGAPPATGQLDLNDTSSPFGLITVNTRGDNPGLGGGGETKEIIGLSRRSPAVVLSVGSNGFGGTWLDSSGTLPPTAASTDERINVDTTPANFPIPPIIAAPPWRTFVRRHHTPAATGCDNTTESQPFCEYDDLLIWLSAPVLFNRLVEARQLP